MARTSDKRERLMEAAVALIHQHGFNQTTLAHIAQESGVPLGNVYYYFKTKEEIAEAVIEEHKARLTQSFKEVDGSEADPKKRLMWFVKKFSGYNDELVSFGCPVGSLCQELSKEASSLSGKADGIMKAQIKWATEQFREMGRKDAADLAVQLIASLQGIALLASALKSPEIFSRQMTRLNTWIAAL